MTNRGWTRPRDAKRNGRARVVGNTGPWRPLRYGNGCRPGFGRPAGMSISENTWERSTLCGDHPIRPVITVGWSRDRTASAAWQRVDPS